MKKKFLCFVIAVIFYTNSMYSQTDTSKELLNTPVIVKSWNEKSFLIGEKFWSDKKEIINSQMGEGAFERVKKYSDPHNIPSAFLPFDGKQSSTNEELSGRLGKLKNLRRVAIFNHIRNGINYGNHVILVVPFDGNENWQAGVKWDIVYFILPEKDVQVLR